LIGEKKMWPVKEKQKGKRGKFEANKWVEKKIF